MARMDIELPNDVVKELEERGNKIEDVIGSMLLAGGNVVIGTVKSNLGKAFKSTAALSRGVRLTKVYKNSDDGRSIKVAFYGNHPTRKSKKYPKGVPLALIASAREYGTSSGEAPKPFFRKAFKQKAAIDAAMQGAHDKFIKD